MRDPTMEEHFYLSLWNIGEHEFFGPYDTKAGAETAVAEESEAFARFENVVVIGPLPVALVIRREEEKEGDGEN